MKIIPSIRPKVIVIISFSIAILGIISQCMAFLPIKIDFGNITYIYSIGLFLPTLDLRLFNSGIFEQTNYTNLLTTNYLSLAMYILLLIGTIIYSISQGSKSRIVRFVLSLLFASNFFSLLSIIQSGISYFEHSDFSGFALFNLIFNIVHLGVYAFLSCIILINIQRSTEVDAELRSYDGQDAYILNDSSILQRHVHLFLDSILCLLIFSKFALMFGQHFWENIDAIFGERGVAFMFLITFRLIYYLFFEITLNATPAKFLTGSRVTDNEGKKPNILSIIQRTFARYIPFDQISFLIHRRWHDKLSGTSVVREK